MDIVKHIKDFGDGAFDALITAPIAIGDFIARGTGIRDWQLGTGNYYMEQARIESELLFKTITNRDTAKLTLKAIGNEIQEKPFYFIGGLMAGSIITAGGKGLLKASSVVSGVELKSVELNSYAWSLTGTIGIAKVHEVVHKLAKENPKMYNLLKDSGILDAIDKSKQSGLFDKLVANLGDFVVNGHSLGDDTANISLYDPIALDLDGNGKIDTLSLENGVFFDHNGDKIAFKSSWVNSSDGILARDIDGDGKITSGAELFGNFTKLKNGELAKNGKEALSDLDSDENGVFDERDEAFGQILVWQDFNSNGKAESGELKSLSEHGIKSINLEFSTDNTALDKDNKQILVGSFAINDSDEALASDIDFSVNTIEREMAESAGLVKGTGFVRDFKPNLSKQIEGFYTKYKELESKAEQIAATDELVGLWAKTAKQYKEIDNPIQKAKINISSVASGTTSSGINEAIKRAEAGEITLSDGVKISA